MVTCSVRIFSWVSIQPTMSAHALLNFCQMEKTSFSCFSCFARREVIRPYLSVRLVASCFNRWAAEGSQFCASSEATSIMSSILPLTSLVSSLRAWREHIKQMNWKMTKFPYFSVSLSREIRMQVGVRWCVGWCVCGGGGGRGSYLNLFHLALKRVQVSRYASV